MTEREFIVKIGARYAYMAHHFASSFDNEVSMNVRKSEYNSWEHDKLDQIVAELLGDTWEWAVENSSPTEIKFTIYK
jgi:hypothetical protein